MARLGFAVIGAVAVAVLPGCTEKTEFYCDRPSDCPSGMCNIADHVCLSAIDGALDAGRDGPEVDAGPSSCDLAGGRIVFQTDRDGDFEIAAILADGSSFQPLTVNGWPDHTPSWSPQGTTIAWHASPSGSSEVHTMRADGTQQQVAGAPGTSAQWAPSGERLLFIEAQNIYAVNSDGTGQVPVTSSSDSAYASWSADSSKIVYARTAGGSDMNIWVVEADGTEPDQLTANVQQEVQPTWSPAGDRIAFLRYNGGAGYRYDLWSMAPAGANQGSLGAGDVYGVSPLAWSPNGSKLAYRVQVSATDFEVWTMNADGSSKVNVSDSPANDGTPRWSPDGARLVFSSSRDGNSEIYVVSADGSGLTRITNDPGEDSNPDWTSCP
jgi:Tol biopolymer transport system component